VIENRPILSLHRFYATLVAVGVQCASALNAQAPIPNPGSVTLCGPRAVVSVCAHHGISATVEEVSKLADYNPAQGCSLGGLRLALIAKGVDAVSVKADTEELKDSDLPAIVYMWGHHFLLVHSIAAGQVDISDPGMPTHFNIPIKEFTDSYSGFAVVISPRVPEVKRNASRPDLRPSTYGWDFGNIDEQEPATMHLRCRNVGNSPLVLYKVTRSSPQLEVTFVGPKTIAPHADVLLPVAYIGTGEGGDKQFTLTLLSNDPASPTVVIDVTGHVRPTRVPLATRRVDFDALRRGKPHVRTLYIKSVPADNLTLGLPRSSSPFVRVDISSSKKAWLPGFFLDLTIESDVPPGDLSATVTLPSNLRADKAVEVAVVAKVAPEMYAEPAALYFGELQGAERRAQTVIKTESNRPIRISRIESSNGRITSRLISTVRGGRGAQTVEASLDCTGIASGNLRGELLVFTESLADPAIRIPIYGYKPAPASPSKPLSSAQVPTLDAAGMAYRD